MMLAPVILKWVPSKPTKEAISYFPRARADRDKARGLFLPGHAD